MYPLAPFSEWWDSGELGELLREEYPECIVREANSKGFDPEEGYCIIVDLNWMQGCNSCEEGVWDPGNYDYGGLDMELTRLFFGGPKEQQRQV